jgi:hypothetical protein
MALPRSHWKRLESSHCHSSAVGELQPEGWRLAHLAVSLTISLTITARAVAS